MKKLVAILLAAALLSLTAFCCAESAQTEVTLYADFSCGSEVAQENALISTKTATISGRPWRRRCPCGQGWISR